MNRALFFFQWGPPSPHLLAALASARCFNPEYPVCLITNEPGEWKHVRGTHLLDTAGLESCGKAAFESAYIHASTNPEFFERLCFYRWFYLEKAMSIHGVGEALLLDNDCLLTTSLSDLTRHTGPAPVHITPAGFPHCTHVRRSAAALLDYFIRTFREPALINGVRRSFLARETFGPQHVPIVASDMYLLWRGLRENTSIGAYRYDEDGCEFLDNCMSWPEGFRTWGRFPMKQV